MLGRAGVGLSLKNGTVRSSDSGAPLGSAPGPPSVPLDPRDARPPNSPAFPAWAQPAGRASWWAQGGAVYRCPVPRRSAVSLSLCFQPLLLLALGIPGMLPLRQPGRRAGCRLPAGRGCGTRWGCGSLIPLFPAAPGSLGLLAEAAQGRAGDSLPAVLSPCLSPDEAAAASG